ncbi:LytR C-terminal domain-containing protein [Streptomyces spiramenti]|uniref:LytR C-terminal domain-containing protein n=1 Tax=Streptomyces spiramenti TaxID=2720606 RepID=A0ABX1AHY9_9ACTN|nr:LytR C-terminal domain-containing protein [Streptomyces spiramenti]NJP66773.1 LytR C-terminal domain-containing protein [Streptomyces spiramenti]
MSMLTPPGMSGKHYRVTGDRYPRMRRTRRRGRTAAGLVASLAVLALLGYGTTQLVDVFTGQTEPAAQAAPVVEPECEVEEVERTPLPEPSAITVNVYNATDRTGLARDTADALAERGFVIGEVDNAPEELVDTVPAGGLLRGADDAEQSGALQVLGSHVGEESAETGTVERDGGEVDLILGEDSGELLDEPRVALLLEELIAAPDDPCADGFSAAGEGSTDVADRTGRADSRTEAAADRN